jgi:hypothetical protein
MGGTIIHPDLHPKGDRTNTGVVLQYTNERKYTVCAGKHAIPVICHRFFM